MSAPFSADAVVIGAGVAGISAAVRLAAEGRRVVIVEAAPRLGGRAAAFTDRETGERVDNGQHALFGCYRETYALLDLLDTRRLAPLQARLAVAMADQHGRQATLACPPLPAPWHLVAGVLRWRAIPFRDRWSASRLGRLLLDARRRGGAAVAADVPPSATVSEWLRAHGQSPALCEWLWHPLAIAALNQSPDVAAAAPFVRVLAELFGPHPTDSAIGLPTVPLDEIYAEPGVRFVEARGGRALLRSPAQVLIDADGRVRGVRAGDAEIDTRVAISTVPWHALEALWDTVPAPLAALVGHATAMRSSPIVTVNLWLDGPALETPFVGLIGGPMHWVFDKRALFGGGAGHLSVVASGADDLAVAENEVVTAAALAQLRQALPALGTRRVQRAVVVRERRATFSLAPGGPPRPGTRTPVPGFFLAGDWIDTGLPGTIEGAALSGRRAAEAASATDPARSRV